MSSRRPLHIVAYDVSEPSRLRRVHDVVKAYSTGGQKSVHECFLGPAELAELARELRRILHPAQDRALILRLDPRMGTHVLGVAEKPLDRPYFYIG